MLSHFLSRDRISFGLILFSFIYKYRATINVQIKLEQLERLRSEPPNPAPPLDYPY